MAYTYQQSSSSNSKNEPGHPEKLREISFSSEFSASVRSQHETISKISMNRWLHEKPPKCIPHSGGIERPGRRPPTPYLPPRLAKQPISGGNGGGDSPRCAGCNARVCIKDTFV